MENQDKFLRDLKKFFWENNINAEEDQYERLANFASCIVEKNETVNLISRKDVDNVVENHIFISYYLSNFIPDRVTRFLDIGTGGGFPGIPLAIAKPLLRGVLVDSTAKKINAVNEFIRKLRLTNVIGENYRVESPEFIEKYKNSFDLVVSRATVPMAVLFRYSVPLIKDRAYLLTIKGGDLDEEYETANLKYRQYIKKSTVFELGYKPTNVRNEKGKKLIVVELEK